MGWARGDVTLRKISAETGHTIVHYLYTGSYQTLESKPSSVPEQDEFGLKQALLVYRAASSHALDDLQQLAMLRIEEHTAAMDLNRVLDITRSQFPKKSEVSGTMQEFIRKRIQKAFEEDHTVFADDAFCTGLLKEHRMNDWVMRHVIQLMSDKLTQASVDKDSSIDKMDGSSSPQLVSETIVAEENGNVLVDSGTNQEKKPIRKKGDEKQKVQREEEVSRTVMNAQVESVGDNLPPPPDSTEVSAPVSGPDPPYEASATTTGPKTHLKLSIHGLEPGIPEDERSESVHSPAAEKENKRARGEWVCKERKEKERLETEQQEQISSQELGFTREDPDSISSTASQDGFVSITRSETRFY